MERLIVAPNYPKFDSPLIFLAGPIQGAENWQLKAAQYILNKDQIIWVASPRRFEKEKGEFTENKYNDQVDWETHNLRLAGKKGTVLFWLSKEFEHSCSRAYAQTTRFELAEWKMKHQYEKSNLALGIEKGFTGERYIKRRLSQDCPEINIKNSLEETCDEAIRLAK